MFDITVSGDYTAVDKAMNGLIAAMRPKALHSLTTQVAWKQVKSKYDERFAAQTKSHSLWQQTKQEVESGLPLGSDPGFLTGTTFNSIAAHASFIEGMIFPEGPWPQGSGNAWIHPLTAEEYGASQFNTDIPINARGQGYGFIWDELGLHANVKGTSPMAFERHPSMMNMPYGDMSGRGGIHWLYLDDEDINIVMSSLEEYFKYIIAGNFTGLKGIFQKAKFAGRNAPGIDDDEVSKVEAEAKKDVADAKKLIQRQKIDMSASSSTFVNPLLNKMLSDAYKEWEAKLKGKK